jgi:4a-hydroxytetrahydrobiopterin dehydratase
MFRVNPLRRSLAALSPAELKTALTTLPGWSIKIAAGDKQVITKEYLFKDFKDAWAFMGSLYTFIDSTDHHPEWSNVYNRVNVNLTTHDVGNKVSEKDIRLALEMEEAASKQLSRK